MVQAEYHSTNAMIPTEDITSALDNLYNVTAYNPGRVYKLILTIHQLTKTNKILLKHIKLLTTTNALLVKHTSNRKQKTSPEKQKAKREDYINKLDLIRYCKVTRYHRSLLCRTNIGVNQYGTTHINKMVGSDSNKEWVPGEA